MAIRSTSTIVTEPSIEPVTLSDVKAYAKIDGSDDDGLLNDLIMTARQSVEKYLKRALITQTWKLTLDLPYNSLAIHLPPGTYQMPVTALYGDMPEDIDLPYKPLQSITSVKFYDTSNTESTYSASNYFADTANGRLIFNDTASLPSNLRQYAACVITFVCGYGADSNTVPSPIKTAIKMFVQKMYDERLICDIPDNCKRLLDQYKVDWLHG
jgi:hypothetical protein